MKTRTVNESGMELTYLDAGVEEYERIYRPLPWQKRGLSQTRTGYGAKLNTGYMALIDGKKYRIYCMCWANSGTCYIVSKGKNIIVDDYQFSERKPDRVPDESKAR